MLRTFRTILGVLTIMLMTAPLMAQTQPSSDQPVPARRPGPNPNAGFLGARFSPIEDDMQEELQLESQDGVLIVEVMKDTPAEKHGLMANDVIRKIDDKAIDDIETFVSTMSQSKPGQEMKFSVLRGKEQKEIGVTLGKRPAQMPGAGGTPPGGGEMPKEPTTRPGN
jgi:S1-C subfamily serine protease